MRSPTRVDLVGDRNVSFVETISRVGVNLTGASFAAQVRLYPDAPGAPPITMTVTLLYGGTATVSAHIAAGRLTAEIYSLINPASGVLYASGDSVVISVLELFIDDSGMVAPYVPAAREAGDDVMMAWDMVITPSGSPADKWFFGEFRVRGTVTY